MARRCAVTGKGPLSGNKRSHSNIKTRTRSLPNLQKRRLWSAALGKFVTLRISTRALRTIDKRGVDVVLKEMGHKL